MADPTVPWGIPLFDDNTPFAPIQAPFNAQSEALNDALSDGAFAPYTTKALLDAAPGTRVGRHATVYADGSDANNGDYSWNGAEWIIAPITVRQQINGVNSVETMRIQSGIGQLGGSGGQFTSGNVTFPVAFSSPPAVIANIRGYRSAGSFSDAGLTAASGERASGQKVSASGFEVVIAASGTLGTSFDFYYSWIAIGTI